MIMRIDVVLPAPFGPMKPYRRAARDREIEPVDGRQRAEGLRHSAQIDRRVARLHAESPDPQNADREP